MPKSRFRLLREYAANPKMPVTDSIAPIKPSDAVAIRGPNSAVPLLNPFRHCGALHAHVRATGRCDTVSRLSRLVSPNVQMLVHDAAQARPSLAGSP
jgi:hypothetical protein